MSLVTKGPSSLDIIEQAMAEIYRSRQANLMQKSKRYMEKLAKKAEKQKGGFNRTPKKIRDENDDEGVASFADSFDYDFDADKEFVEKQRAKTPTNTDSSTAAGIISSKAKKPGLGPPRFGSDGVYENGILVSAPTKVEEHPDEVKGREIRQQFTAEVGKWWDRVLKEKRHKDIDTRGKFADYLTDKYMCQLLDKLQPGRIVSGARKDISSLIELLGSTSKDLPKEYVLPKAEPKKPDASSNINNNSSNSSSNNNNNNNNSNSSNNSINSNSNSSDASTSSRPTSSSKQKEKLDKEKQAIKEQYAAFVTSKKNADMMKAVVGGSTARPGAGASGSSLAGLPSMDSSKKSVDRQSAEMEKQYESLNDDIKDLINQLHSRK